MRSRSHFRRSGAIAKESFFQGGGDYRLTDFVAKGNRTCCMHPLPGSSIRLINIKDSPICLTISINSKLHLLSSYQNKATCLASNISKVLISQLNILSIILRRIKPSILTKQNVSQLNQLTRKLSDFHHFPKRWWFAGASIVHSKRVYRSRKNRRFSFIKFSVKKHTRRPAQTHCEMPRGAITSRIYLRCCALGVVPSIDI